MKTPNAQRRPEPRFPLESIVYPKVAPTSDNACTVTGLLERPGGQLTYLVTGLDGDEKERHECELVAEARPDWLNKPQDTEDED